MWQRVADTLSRNGEGLIGPRMGKALLVLLITSLALNVLTLPGAVYAVTAGNQGLQYGAVISGLSWPILTIVLIGGLCLRRRRLGRSNLSPCLQAADALCS